MKVSIKSVEGDLNFQGTNHRGQSIPLSGTKEGVSPMEALLMATASCTAIDIELLLKKMRQDMTKLHIDVNSERAEDETPKRFVSISLHYKIEGDVSEKKANKAVSMAVEKYCAVLKSLDPKIEVGYAFELVG